MFFSAIFNPLAKDKEAERERERDAQRERRTETNIEKERKVQCNVVGHKMPSVTESRGKGQIILAIYSHDCKGTKNYVY